MCIGLDIDILYTVYIITVSIFRGSLRLQDRNPFWPRSASRIFKTTWTARPGRCAISGCVSLDLFDYCDRVPVHLDLALAHSNSLMASSSKPSVQSSTTKGIPWRQRISFICSHSPQWFVPSHKQPKKEAQQSAWVPKTNMLQYMMQKHEHHVISLDIHLIQIR